jgi:hypothetical protein
LYVNPSSTTTSLLFTFAIPHVVRCSSPISTCFLGRGWSLKKKKIKCAPVFGVTELAALRLAPDYFARRIAAASRLA